VHALLQVDSLASELKAATNATAAAQESARTQVAAKEASIQVGRPRSQGEGRGSV